MHLSIRMKTIALILLFAMVLISTSVIIYSRVIVEASDERYLKKADDLARTVAGVVDGDRFMHLKSFVESRYNSVEDKVKSDQWGTAEFDEYSAKFADIESSYEFMQMRKFLADIAEVNEVDCVYLCFIDTERENFVYVVDSAEEDPCPPGCIDYIYEINRDVLTDPSRGFPAYETNTDEYGALITAGAPVYDSRDRLVGYAMTDISITQIREAQKMEIVRFIIPLIAVLLLLCVLGILIVNRLLVKPIKALSKAARDYGIDRSDGKRSSFADVKINTRDELEEFAESMKKMEDDINDYIARLISINRELAEQRHVVYEMTELANRDALTGVRNKTAYDTEIEILESEISSGTAAFAIAIVDMNGLKKFNDTYGHQNGDEAIKRLCATICDVFDHSAIFRIGGDEFAIILKNNQLEKIDSLTKEFDERLKTESAKGKEPWEKVSAAIGYAVVEKNDVSVSDVFRRADKAMYDRKSEMKKLGL